MSIFGKIKDAIFGKAAAAPAAKPAAAPAAPTARAPAQPRTAQPTAARTPAAQVDVEQVLSQIAASKGNPDLNYKSSIVDLMKLLDLDSSLANRKELATELGYTGDKDGSAEMNIWLHKAVMRQLAQNGGKVPASMTD
jgi:3-oxoacyl-ACP reductase-like protein